MNVAGMGMRVVVATRPVDFRKGHDGLAAVVAEALEAAERALYDLLDRREPATVQRVERLLDALTSSACT